MGGVSPRPVGATTEAEVCSSESSGPPAVEHPASISPAARARTMVTMEGECLRNRANLRAWGPTSWTARRQRHGSRGLWSGQERVGATRASPQLEDPGAAIPVSYTHLTLPTIYSV